MDYEIPDIVLCSFSWLAKQKLNMLIHFLPIRFRKYLNRKKNGIKLSVAESRRKDLTEFIQECIMIIDREKENGTLTDTAGKVLPVKAVRK